MATTGNVFAGTGENNAGIGATAWTNPGNVVSDNTTDATCNAAASSQYLVARNFTFDIPANATIKGVTVRIEASEHTSGTESLNAQLQNDVAALIGSSKSATISGTAKAVYTYGSATDLWGATLTAAMLSDADFGVRFWFTTVHDVRADYVTIAVEYFTPSDQDSDWWAGAQSCMAHLAVATAALTADLSAQQAQSVATSFQPELARQELVAQGLPPALIALDSDTNTIPAPWRFGEPVLPIAGAPPTIVLGEEYSPPPPQEDWRVVPVAMLPDELPVIGKLEEVYPWVQGTVDEQVTPQPFLDPSADRPVVVPKAEEWYRPPDPDNSWYPLPFSDDPVKPVIGTLEEVYRWPGGVVEEQEPPLVLRDDETLPVIGKLEEVYAQIGGAADDYQAVAFSDDPALPVAAAVTVVEDVAPWVQGTVDEQVTLQPFLDPSTDLPVVVPKVEEAYRPGVVDDQYVPYLFTDTETKPVIGTLEEVYPWVQGTVDDWIPPRILSDDHALPIAPPATLGVEEVGWPIPPAVDPWRVVPVGLVPDELPVIGTLLEVHYQPPLPESAPWCVGALASDESLPAAIVTVVSEDAAPVFPVWPAPSVPEAFRSDDALSPNVVEESGWLAPDVSSDGFTVPVPWAGGHEELAPVAALGIESDTWTSPVGYQEWPWVVPAPWGFESIGLPSPATLIVVRLTDLSVPAFLLDDRSLARTLTDASVPRYDLTDVTKPNTDLTDASVPRFTLEDRHLP